MILSKKEFSINYPNVTLLGDSIKIGKNVTISSGVTIGYDVKIGNGVTMGDKVTIGNEVTVGSGVTIGSSVTINNDVTVLSQPIGYIVEIRNNKYYPYVVCCYKTKVGNYIQLGCYCLTISEWETRFNENRDAFDDNQWAERIELFELCKMILSI